MTEILSVNEVDLNACAAEPIRIPGGIQPHGALIVVEAPTGRVLHVSANAADFLETPIAPGDRLTELPAFAALAPDLALLADADGDGGLSRTAEIGGLTFQVSAHVTPQGLLVELEPPPPSREQTLEAIYPRLRRFLDFLGVAAGLSEIAQAAVKEVRTLTGFNRVLLYSFDEKGDGTVLAEDSDGVLPSYLDLRFPAFDIPPQARELYRLSRIRLIPTADYAPAAILPPISPIDGQPLDLGRAALRSVSPVHLEYMRNMGTYSSMSISILVEGQLWGLISGHSREPRHVNAQIRSACDHLGQVLSLQIEAREQARRNFERLRLTELQTDLLTRIALAPTWIEGLSKNPEAWQDVGGGAGVALVSEDDFVAVGLTPDEAEIRRLAGMLFQTGRGEFVTESLAERWPECADFADVASGLLAVSVSQIHPNYMMWFRPEARRTVNWAGEPQKAVEIGERLHPRKSFELWKEQVHLRALPWRPEEIESARRFRGAIQNFVLRRAEERAELTQRLTEINRELESFSYSISHDLRAPFRHVVGYAELLAQRSGEGLDETSRHYLSTIKEAALSAGRLVDDLLNFSQLGRNSLTPTEIDMTRLVGEVRRGLHAELQKRPIEWRVGALPKAWGDPAMIRQVLQNLMENAVKYSAGREPAVIDITGEENGAQTSYSISDNGVGFDPAYAHKLFAVFERLHSSEEFPGTGIGLALVKRIVTRHGGTVGAAAVPGEGATFTFTLPKRRLSARGDSKLG